MPKDQEFSGEKIEVDASRYLSVDNPERIRKNLSVYITDHCYLPSVDDIQQDWVAYVASPAFKLIRKARGKDIGSFCSIGTGSGLDVLTAAELLGAKRVGLTDIHEDVVSAAVENVKQNHKQEFPLTIEAGFGDLLEPLRKYKSKYDIIYENLPNVPARSTEEAVEERKSSTHVPPRKETIPALIKNQMLDLHYLALVQARDFLEKGGAILSTLGARVPLKVFLALGESAGYTSSILTYTWKLQAVPEDVIRGYSERQKEGFGPFYFYRADFLEKTFASIDAAESGARAFEIEEALLPERFDAESAYKALKNGVRIGHTVAVLKSELR